jgi:hypothetical protein
MSKRERQPGKIEPDQDHTDTEPRTRRAIDEEMDIVFVGIGAYVVHSESGHRYRIDIFEESCTCPDWQKSSTPARCKHIRRVKMEINARTVPRPDGRIVEVRSVRPDERSTDPTEQNLEAENEDRVSGPIPEFDRYGHSTGAEYWRCRSCTREALQRDDLECDDCRE